VNALNFSKEDLLEDQVTKPKVPKTFWSKAYLVEEEKNTYILYRDFLVEGKGSDGNAVREKIGKPVPVGKPLREAIKGEEQRVVVRTFHPTESRLMELVEIEE